MCRLKTFQIAQGEKLQNIANDNTVCNSLNLSIPLHSVAATFNPGRLGNQISSFASLYSVWREFKVRNFINMKQYKMLSDIFDLPIRKEASENVEWPYYIWNDSKSIIID